MQTVILAAMLLGLRPLPATASDYADEVLAILVLTALDAVGLGLLASTLARSETRRPASSPTS